MEKVVIGYRDFGGVVDITDPCYDKDTWCRINGVEVVPGRYECSIQISDEGVWGKRVAVIGIYLTDCSRERGTLGKIGEIGVDAGLAGFFEDKPDYSGSEWSRFCDLIDDGNKAWIFSEGFFSESGWGDGEYNVYALKDKSGKAIAIEIYFIEEEDGENE